MLNCARHPGPVLLLAPGVELREEDPHQLVLGVDPEVGEEESAPGERPGAAEAPVLRGLRHHAEAQTEAVAVRLDRDPNAIDIADRFQMRDPVIEHIGWTLKADMDSNLDRAPCVGGLREIPRDGGGRLLRDGKRKLFEVAHLVGYESDGAFNKAFKRVLGVTPGEYRTNGGARAHGAA